MAWNVVTIENSANCRSKPYASVGFSRISLNVAACSLLDDPDQYKYAEFLTDQERKSVVGIRFLKDATGGSIVLKRKNINGKVVGGIDISSKAHVEKLFGVKGTQKQVTRYDVIQDENNPEILIVIVK